VHPQRSLRLQNAAHRDNCRVLPTVLVLHATEAVGDEAVTDPCRRTGARPSILTALDRGLEVSEQGTLAGLFRPRCRRPSDTAGGSCDARLTRALVIPSNRRPRTASPGRAARVVAPSTLPGAKQVRARQHLERITRFTGRAHMSLVTLPNSVTDGQNRYGKRERRSSRVRLHF